MRAILYSENFGAVEIFRQLGQTGNCFDMGLVMVRPVVMAGAADGIRAVVVAKANAAPGRATPGLVALPAQPAKPGCNPLQERGPR